MICDLASMKSIRNFVEEFKAKYTTLDVLYNNAAVMKQKRTNTEDGFEMMSQVNYLAPVVLINSLVDLLKNSQSPQILNNGRPTDKLRLDMEDLQFSKKYAMYNSFFKTKLCLLFANMEFSRRLEKYGISVSMADPGPFKSDLVRDMPIAGWFKNLFSAPVYEAADNLLYVLTASGIGNKNGKVFQKKQEKPLAEYWQDTGVSGQLWSMTKDMLEKNQM